MKTKEIIVSISYSTTTRISCLEKIKGGYKAHKLPLSLFVDNKLFMLVPDKYFTKYNNNEYSKLYDVKSVKELTSVYSAGSQKLRYENGKKYKITIEEIQEPIDVLRKFLNEE